MSDVGFATAAPVAKLTGQLIGAREEDGPCELVLALCCYALCMKHAPGSCGLVSLLLRSLQLLVWELEVDNMSESFKPTESTCFHVQ